MRFFSSKKNTERINGIVTWQITGEKSDARYSRHVPVYLKRCLACIQKQSLLIIHNEIRAEEEEEEEEKIKAQFGANCVQNKQHLLNHMESNRRIVCMPRSERERDVERIELVFSQLLCLLNGTLLRCRFYLQ